MSLISKDYTFSTGTTIVAGEHNQNFDTLYNAINGNLDNSNIKSNAAIAESKLNTITTIGKVNFSALVVGSAVAGDLIYGASASSLTRFPIGTATKQLKINGTELDFMEYSSDILAYNAYITQDILDVIHQTGDSIAHSYTGYTNGAGALSIDEDLATAQQEGDPTTDYGNANTTKTCVSQHTWDTARDVPTITCKMRTYSKQTGVNGNADSYSQKIEWYNGSSWTEISALTVSGSFGANTGTHDVTTTYTDQAVNLTGVKGLKVTTTAQAQTADGHSWAAAYIYELETPGTTNFIPYSEATIKIQGDYSLKAIAAITTSLNKTLTKTLASPVDLTGVNTLNFGLRSSRIGSNIKIGIYEGANLRAEITPTIATANSWEIKTWDISAVTDANKNAIDKIVITIINADAANTFYIDSLGARNTTTLLQWQAA